MRMRRPILEPARIFEDPGGEDGDRSCSAWNAGYVAALDAPGPRQPTGGRRASQEGPTARRGVVWMPAAEQLEKASVHFWKLCWCASTGKDARPPRPRRRGEERRGEGVHCEPPKHLHPSAEPMRRKHPVKPSDVI